MLDLAVAEQPGHRRSSPARGMALRVREAVGSDPQLDGDGGRPARRPSRRPSGPTRSASTCARAPRTWPAPWPATTPRSAPASSSTPRSSAWPQSRRRAGGQHAQRCGAPAAGARRPADDSSRSSAPPTAFVSPTSAMPTTSPVRWRSRCGMSGARHFVIAAARRLRSSPTATCRSHPHHRTRAGDSPTIRCVAATGWPT